MSTQTVMILAAVPIVLATVVLFTSDPRSKRSLLTLGAGVLYAVGFVAVFHHELGVGK